jgi:integrase
LELCRYKVQPNTRNIYQYTIEANIAPFFGSMRADKLTTDLLLKYRKKRGVDGAVFSTISRELVVLRAALRAAAHASPPLIPIASVPRFVIEDERSRTRSGFVGDDVFETVLAELPEYLRPITVCAYNSAVRKGELLKIQWRQVDFDAKLIRLKQTKNGDPRTIPFLGEMEVHLRKAKAERDEFFADCPWVFSRLGEPIKSFKGSWKSAALRAGVPTLLFHDFRRSGIRNLTRAGVRDE